MLLSERKTKDGVIIGGDGTGLILAASKTASSSAEVQSSRMDLRALHPHPKQGSSGSSCKDPVRLRPSPKKGRATPNEGQNFLLALGTICVPRRTPGKLSGKAELRVPPPPGLSPGQRLEQKQRVAERELPPGWLFTPRAWKASQRGLSHPQDTEKRRAEGLVACVSVPHATCSLERGFNGQLRQKGLGPTQPWVLCGIEEWWWSLFAGLSGGKKTDTALLAA